MTLSEETSIVGSEIVKPEEGRPSWKNRKRVIFLTLAFCAFCILYILFQGNDTRINETIALGCFALAGSVIGFYVAGAAWTDVSIEKIKSDRPPVARSKPVVKKNTVIEGQEPEIIDSLSNGKGDEDA